MNYIKATVFFVSLLLFCTCSIQDSRPLEEHYKALAACPDTVFTIDYFEAIAPNNLNVVMSSVNFDNIKIHALAATDKKVQKIVNEKREARKFIRSDSSFHFSNDILDEEDQLNIESFISHYSIDQMKLNKKDRNDLINRLLKQVNKKQEKSYLWSYNYLRFLIILGETFEYENNTQGALITYSYALSFIENHRKKEEYQGIKEKIINKLILVFIREEASEEYKNSIDLLVQNLSPSFNKSFEGLMIKAYLAEMRDTSLITYKTYLDKAISSTNQDHKLIVGNFNLGIYYYLTDNKKQALFHYKKALSYFKGQVCSTIYYRILLSQLELEPTKDKDRLKKRLDSIEYCAQDIQDYLSFIKVQYDGFEEPQETLSKKVNRRIELKNLGESLFPGTSTLHLQDFYLMNTLNMLSLFETEEKIEQQYISKVINLVLDTRLKDIARQKIIADQDIDYSGCSTEFNVNKGLLSLNNFRDLKAFSNSIYQDLFYNYLRQKLRKNYEVKVPSLDVNGNQKRTDFSDTVLINFIRGEEYYYAYILHDGNMQIERIDRDTLDVLLRKNYDLYKDRMQVDNAELKSLFDGVLSECETKNVVVIPDGVLTNYPLDDIFGMDKNVNVYTNLDEFINAKPVVINQTEINIYSFTGQESLADKQEKEVPELPIGYEECNRIAEILKLNESGLFYHQKFSRQNVTSSKAKVAHISSHAYSSMSNRFENYILLRDENDVNKIYGFELYNLDRLPEVVILSACESGIGLHAYGAGVQTLSRAFLDNGTQTVIKTLWKVNEKATMEFMVEMYTHWVIPGMNLHDALKKTKESFKTHAKYSAPYYWAGFVLEGNPNVYLNLES